MKMNVMEIGLYLSLDLNVMSVLVSDLKEMLSFLIEKKIKI